ncbi:MAG TPA: TlpA disulfide reductase family protein [Bryobacteraceae bacterium]|nr:TlpA disulfide reductase family protein [Bryobacteraceae bacterium]
MRRLLALLCLATIAWAKLPRQLANVPIETPDHRNIDLRKFRGKIVMVVLFLTDCDDCVDMINFASKLETQYASRGFQVVGAALNDAAPYEVAPFVQRYRPTFPIGFLRKDGLIKFADLSPQGHPVAPIIMFIDGLGVVRFEWQGHDVQLKQKEKLFPAIILGLINQRDRHQEPERVTEPVKR